MEKKLSQFISVIAHPIFVLSYAFAIILYTDNFFSFSFTPKGKLFFLSYIVLLSVVFPLIVVFLLKQFKQISSFTMETRQERKFPLIMLGFSYLIMYYFIDRLRLSPIFNLMILGSIMLCVLLLLVNNFWKMSIHATVWGGFLGMILAISMRFNIDLFFYIILIILISGFVGFARLKLRAHNESQLYIGYIFGFLLMLLLFYRV